VRNIAAGFYARRVLEVGREVNVAGQTGVLSAITPTHLVLESEGGEAMVVNGQVLDGVVRQS
jgi:hypothetical protein